MKSFRLIGLILFFQIFIFIKPVYSHHGAEGISGVGIAGSFPGTTGGTTGIDGSAGVGIPASPIGFGAAGGVCVVVSSCIVVIL